MKEAATPFNFNFQTPTGIRRMFGAKGDAENNLKHCHQMCSQTAKTLGNPE